MTELEKIKEESVRAWFEREGKETRRKVFELLNEMMLANINKLSKSEVA